MSADCLFCKIVRKEIPSGAVFEDDAVYAFRDIAPQAPTHVLVVPKGHTATLAETPDAALLGALLAGAAAVARREGLDHYRVVLNNGSRAGQSVFHLHAHVLGGRDLSWPPG